MGVFNTLCCRYIRLQYNKRALHNSNINLPYHHPDFSTSASISLSPYLHYLKQLHYYRVNIVIILLQHTNIMKHIPIMMYCDKHSVHVHHSPITLQELLAAASRIAYSCSSVSNLNSWTANIRLNS